MRSTQINIALSVVATLSSEELDFFAQEFDKMCRPKTKPKKNTYKIPDVQELANQLLIEHRQNFRKHPDASQNP